MRVRWVELCLPLRERCLRCGQSVAVAVIEAEDTLHEGLGDVDDEEAAAKHLEQVCVERSHKRSLFIFLKNSLKTILNKEQRYDGASQMITQSECIN